MNIDERLIRNFISKIRVNSQLLGHSSRNRAKRPDCLCFLGYATKALPQNNMVMKMMTPIGEFTY